jgi:hypothetical protein
MNTQLGRADISSFSREARSQSVPGVSGPKSPGHVINLKSQPIIRKINDDYRHHLSARV